MYNAAPICYGAKAPIEAWFASSGRAVGLGDSLMTTQNTPAARYFWALAFCTTTWGGRIAALDCQPFLSGADGTYNLNASDVANSPGFCQAQFSMSGGTGDPAARDLPGLWSINEDQATQFGGYDDGGGANFAHYCDLRGNAWGLHAGATATGGNTEYARQAFRLSILNAKSANKLGAGTEDLALRLLAVHPAAAGSTDSIVRRLVDGRTVAVGDTTVLTGWPTIRFHNNFWKPGPGNALDAAGGAPSFGSGEGVLNAYRGDSADASGLINDMGDFRFLSRSAGTSPQLAIRAADVIAAGRWMPHAGGVLYETDGNGDFDPGKQLACYGINSAAYADIGGTGTAKNVSEERLTRLLYLTALDLSDPLVIVYCFGEETGATLEDRIGAMVDSAQAAAEAAGYTDIHHLLLSGAARDGGAGEAAAQAESEENRDAMRAVVDTRTTAGLSIAHVSAYDATGGVLLNGSAAAIAYMADYDAFEWGDGQVVDLTHGILTDDHPSGDNECAFFAVQSLTAMSAFIASSGGGARGRGRSRGAMRVR